MKIQSVCVYCGSNMGHAPSYAANAARLGGYLAAHRIRLVYGGAFCGTMGVLADSCLKQGGDVLGIITEHLNRIVGHKGLNELVVPDMATRKALFLKNSDALIALPGGLGTADELLEAMSLQTLGLNPKPIALLNVDDFFAPLLAWFEKMCEANFLFRAQFEQLIVDTEIESMFEKMEAFEYRPIHKWDVENSAASGMDSGV